jgi:hypothetical protein
LRGTWKRLPPWAIGTIIVTATAIGWFLPLLGLSLAGFVLVDVLVGVAKSRKENADA